MSLNLASLLVARAARHPKRPAVVLGDVTLDYGTLDALSRRFAGVLAALGVKRGEHVALLLPNVPYFSVAYFGAHMAGCPVVPLNVLLTAPEVAYHLKDSDAVAIIAWEGMAEAALAGAAQVPGCRHVVVVTADRAAGPPDGAVGFHAAMAAATPIDEPVATMPDDPAVLLYTSGTTGAAKGAQLSHFNMYYNAEYSGSRLLPLGEDTVALVTLPLFHSFGQTVMHNAVLGRGGTCVLLPRFDAGAAFGLMQRHKVTFFGGVPTMYFALLHHPDADRFDLSALKLCVSGGAAMPVEVMRAFDAKYGVNILEGYGLSETSPVASFNVLDRPKKPGSVGLPLEGVWFRLTDPDGAVITAPDTPGEIEIKGHNVMLGYYNKPDANAEVLRDGWFRTGDIAVRDADGYYFIVDRSKDMILRGGFNVYPREVEEVLYGHPAIAEAAVIGQPDDRLGEEVVAVVALKPGAAATEDELIAHCKERLAAYKRPRAVRFVDALPKGPTGKILKRELR